jgi:CrcB protein
MGREPADGYPASSMTNLILLFVAGGLGTLARYGMNQLAASVITHDFPYGTSVINAIGCLLFGVALGLVNEKVLPSAYAPVVMVGFLGAFTTFSAFAAEAHDLMQNARWFAFAAYLTVQNVLGILFVGLGLRLAQ